MCIFSSCSKEECETCTYAFTWVDADGEALESQDADVHATEAMNTVKGTDADGDLCDDALTDAKSAFEGMDDYEWIFQIGKKDFEALLKLLKGTNDLSEDVPTELMNYLKDNGTKVSEIRKLCQDNEIEHYFQNWM